MLYQVLSPFVYSIDADGFYDAIKNIVKINHYRNINELIITDRVRNMKAIMKYYKNDGRNKVGINVYPLGKYGSYIDTNETYNPPLIATPGVIAPAIIANKIPDNTVAISAVPFIPMQIPKHIL